MALNNLQTNDRIEVIQSALFEASQHRRRGRFVRYDPKQSTYCLIVLDGDSTDTRVPVDDIYRERMAHA